jgi:hypothetical protein
LPWKRYVSFCIPLGTPAERKEDKCFYGILAGKIYRYGEEIAPVFDPKMFSISKKEDMNGKL